MFLLKIMHILTNGIHLNKVAIKLVNVNDIKPTPGFRSFSIRI